MSNDQPIKGALLYKGKAKSVYEVQQDPSRVILEFRNDTSAFNGVKLAQLAHKGAVNNQLNAFIMGYLADKGVPTHFERMLSPTESLVRRLRMVPVESVIRNRSAGHLCKRLGIPENQILTPPILEFFFKNDALNDPMVNHAHMITLGWATQDEIAQMEILSHQVNELLCPLFEKAGLYLVDFKLEFGVQDGKMYLGDEWSPDACRLWDMKTLEKFDKDRFRQDLGGVIEHYQMVGDRLGVQFQI